MSTSQRLLSRWWWVYLVVSVVHVGALAFSADQVAQTTKALLMPTLLLAVGQSLRWRFAHHARLLMAALVWSWIGDCAGLVLPESLTLPVMLASFGIAHGYYIVLFWRHLATRPLPRPAGLLLIWWIAMLAVIGPASGSLVIAVAGYGLLLAATTASALRCQRLIRWGGLLFLTSDSLLAMELFLQSPSWVSPAVMATYTAAQALLAVGSLVQLRRPAR